MVWTNPITWTIGQILTAAQMNEQVRDNMSYLYAQPKVEPGIVADYGGATPPTGWLLCDGSAVNRTTYAALFAAIGTAWGAGDGSSTFNLPDLRGRAAIGAGAGAGLTARTLAQSGGEETHTLSAGELTNHTHTQNSHGHSTSAHSHDLNVTTTSFGGGSTNIVIPASGIQQAGTFAQTAGINNTTATNQNTGSSTPFNVMPPFRVLNKIIKT